jgi:thymidylate synthase (FAD)
MKKPVTARDLLELDQRLKIEVLSKTDNPQRLCWINMHQCYSEGAACKSSVLTDPTKDESWFGNKVVEYCLQTGGHWSVTESPALTVNVVGFPHDVMQQIRTHRVGLNFQVQSGRYTSKRFTGYPKNGLDIEDLIYMRPIGVYTDRDNPVYDFTQEWRDNHRTRAVRAVYEYGIDIDNGMSPEHAREMSVYGFRQNFCMTVNARSLMHILDMRVPLNSQLEIQALGLGLFDIFKEWMPEIATFYETKRLGKSRLAP